MPGPFAEKQVGPLFQAFPCPPPRFPWHADHHLVSASVLLFCGLRGISVFTFRDALGAFFVVACCFGGGLF